MFSLNCKGRLLVVDKPLVMGVINLTPDSFFTASRKTNNDDVLIAVEKMLNDGASIIDLGGQSTRPGSKRVSEDEELSRVIGNISDIISHFPGAILSIDTYYARVAEMAVDAGASIINDVTAGSLDPGIIKVASEKNVPYILMHLKGNLDSIHQPPAYENVTREVVDFFIQKQDEFIKQGVYQLILDPGFGFGKSANDNMQLLRNLSSLKMLGKPILAGLSRKSTITKILGVSADNALNGTTVLNTIALMNGASILRVHDVKEAVEAVKLVNELEKNTSR